MASVYNFDYLGKFLTSKHQTWFSPSQDFKCFEFERNFLYILCDSQEKEKTK